jgi:AhpD family alkylhydroperoxidase
MEPFSTRHWVWARAPKVFLAVAFLYGMIDRKSSPIGPVLRSLVIVRVSQLNGCQFCVDVNSATLLKRGIPSEKIAMSDSWQKSDLFTEQERIVLEYAEAVTLRKRWRPLEMSERGLKVA